MGGVVTMNGFGVWLHLHDDVDGMVQIKNFSFHSSLYYQQDWNFQSMAREIIEQWKN